MVFYSIVEDVAATRMRQHMSVFEPFKFIGVTIKCQTPETIKSPIELLKRLEESDTDHFQVVGVIVPNLGAVIKGNRRVMSDGQYWGILESVCKTYGTEMQTV